MERKWPAVNNRMSTGEWSLCSSTAILSRCGSTCCPEETGKRGAVDTATGEIDNDALVITAGADFEMPAWSLLLLRR